MSRVRTGSFKSEQPLRIGFMPGTDCAPLIYAKESGLFEQYGLQVELKRELTWAGIGDKVINGELDAAQVSASLPFIANLGVDSDHGSLVSAMIMSSQGSAVTISRRLWAEGVRDAQTLLGVICRRWGKRTLAFGVPSRFSTQSFLLEKWLATAGINSRTQVRVVAVPAEHMFATLKLGYIDGFVSPEPWNTVAVHAGEGMCLATSPELMPMHPETVLVVRQGFAAGAYEKHRALIQALMKAAAIIERPEERALLAELLSQAAYVNAPPPCLAAALVGPFSFGFERSGVGPEITFRAPHMNEPTDERAMWLMQHLYVALEMVPDQMRGRERPPVLKNAFRRDVFHVITGDAQSGAKPDMAGVSPVLAS